MLAPRRDVRVAPRLVRAAGETRQYEEGQVVEVAHRLAPDVATDAGHVVSARTGAEHLRRFPMPRLLDRLRWIRTETETRAQRFLRRIRRLFCIRHVEICVAE